ncbi:hypothetical protein C8R32_11537 [Nitrosospira sp. Nsp5]|uniref:Uncharacterized protein n=1 Tax=Nitrosospira multiformis TaxID=1231 RepID=A0ABY0TE24_9PROT|nr:hypothetical protein C8R32_11537 [Nitrosospira sp. Nsp5]SDQ60361.1 hypothetical protein SAMN05216402_1508 [Nitrosospira multiformis]
MGRTLQSLHYVNLHSLLTRQPVQNMALIQ